MMVKSPEQMGAGVNYRVGIKYLRTVGGFSVVIYVKAGL